MKSYRLTAIVVAVLTLTVTVGAQNPPQLPPVPETPAAARPPKQPIVPLEVQVVIARYQGEKRVSSMPYTLAVNANAAPATELNMGAEVPIPSTTFTPVSSGEPKPPAALRSFNYRSIGTSIVARASSADDNRFELTLNIDESSVYTKADGPGGANDGELPVFRNFRSRNTLLLRDGQVRQYTAATDRASGETFRIEVTLKIVK